jgi:hypothetical protein
MGASERKLGKKPVTITKQGARKIKGKGLATKEATPYTSG